MEKKEIEQQVIKVIVDYFNGLSTVIRPDPEDLKMDSTFDDIGADSLDKLSIIMNVEDSFGIWMDDEEAEGLKTIGELVAVVEKLQNKIK